MTREDQVEKILDELEEEFAKANMPVNDKLTLFAKVSNAIYKYAEQEPCTDVISRQAVLEAIEDDNRNAHYSCFASNNDAECFKQIIRELPSVTPQHCEDVPDTNVGDIYECSCGYGWDKSKAVRHHFCPNCGAKVEVGE